MQARRAWPALGTRWPTLVAAALGLSLAASGLPVRAQDADTKARLEATRKALEQKQKAEKDAAADIGQLRTEREQLNRELVEMARLIQKSEGQLNTIEARLGELEAQEKLLKGSLAQRHDQVARLLGAMQRMGRNPPPVLITERQDALKMVRSAAMLARLYPELSEQALGLSKQLSDLARVMGESKAEGDKLRAETTRLNEARTRLAMLMESKKQNLAVRQAELDQIRREASEITRNVNDLNELISRLDRAVATHTGQDIAPKTPTPPPAQAAPVETTVAMAPIETAPPRPPVPISGAAEQPALRGPAIAAVTPPPASPAAPAAGGLVAPLKPAEKPIPAIELAPKGQVASLNPGRLAPAIPFAQMRGKLQLPAQGRRVLAFGEKTQHGEKARGVVLETRVNGQVTAPADSWVVFAGEFRSFGQLLIMNAGDGYHILLAGLSQIDVQVGEFVLAGQPVGVMSGPGKAGKTKSDQAPVLYIEFRKDSRPIDPEPWWAAEGLIKVQG